MRYGSLDITDIAKRVISQDGNNQIIYLLTGSNNWTTLPVDVNDKLEVNIIPSSIAGSGGVITYQQSMDNLTWLNVRTNDDSADVTFSINDNTVHTLKDFVCVTGYRRLVYTKGSLS